MLDFRMTIVVFGALATACGSGEGSESDRGAIAAITSDAHVCKLLDGYVGSADVADRRILGYSVVLSGDRKQILLRCAGGDQNIGTTHPISSASTPPSAATVMTPINSNQLLLDLRVAQHLLASGADWSLDKMLITMRTLLPDNAGLAGLSPDHLQPACRGKLTGIRLKECVAQPAAAPQVAEPGPAFNNGAAGNQIAGYIASQVADQRWEEFFVARIGVPLGHSVRSYGDLIEVNHPDAKGGATSNVADYAKVLLMLMNQGHAHGATVLTARSVNGLRTNQIAGRIVRYSPADKSLYPGYTFGFFISDRSLHSGGARPRRSTSGQFGSTPWINEDPEYGAVLLIDKDRSSGAAMWNAVRPLIISALEDI